MGFAPLIVEKPFPRNLSVYDLRFIWFIYKLDLESKKTASFGTESLSFLGLYAKSRFYLISSHFSLFIRAVQFISTVMILI